MLLVVVQFCIASLLEDIVYISRILNSQEIQSDFDSKMLSLIILPVTKYV